jgi:Vitamin K-dependent gamma-carboxylase
VTPGRRDAGERFWLATKSAVRTANLSLVGDAWDRFWFAPKSPLPVAAFRILLGIMLLQFVVLILPDATVWYGPNGTIRAESLPNLEVNTSLNILNIFPHSTAAVYVLFAVLSVASAALILGFRTRLAAFLIFICLLTLYHRNPFNMNSGDSYMRQMIFWLIFAGSGQALSLDKILADRKGKLAPHCAIVACWPQRMLQLQTCFVYAHSFYSKIIGPSWETGTAVYLSSRLIELKRFPLPFVFDQLWTCQLLTWGTLLLEYSFCTLIWVKPLRYPIIFLAIIFHLILDWHMNIPQFEWLMMIGFLNFVEGKDIARFLDFCQQFRINRARPVVSTHNP